MNSLARAIAYLLFVFVWIWAAGAVAWLTRSVYGLPGILVLLFGGYLFWKALKPTH